MKNYLTKKDTMIIIATLILGVVASVVYIWHNSIGFLLLSMAWCAGIIWASKYITRMISQYNYLHQDFRDICISNEDYEKRENALRNKLEELQDKFDIAMADNRKKDETIKDLEEERNYWQDGYEEVRGIVEQKDAEIDKLGKHLLKREDMFEEQMKELVEMGNKFENESKKWKECAQDRLLTLEEYADREEDLKGKLHDTEDALAELRAELDRYKEDAADLIADKKNREEYLKDLERKHKLNMDRRFKLERKYQEVKNNANKVADNIEIAMEENEKLKGIIIERENRILELRSENEMLVHEEDILNVQIKERIKSIERLKEENKVNLDKLRNANNTIENLSDYRDQLQKKIASLIEDGKAVERDMKGWRSKAKSKDAEIEKLKKKYADLKENKEEGK